MILAIRTDKPEAELYLIDNDQEIGREIWQAHRELSDTLLDKIEQILDRSEVTKRDLRGIVVFQGPGSFTGLRIGITIANTLAHGLQLPIVGTQGDNWHTQGLQKLVHQASPTVILPVYGGEAHITQPKK